MDNVTVANAVASASASHGSFSPAILETIKTWIAYVGVLATAIVVAYSGIRKAIKDLRGGDAPALMNPGGPAAHAGVQNIVGGTIMETTTLLMWSESNRAVAETADAVKTAILANTEAIECLPDEMDQRNESIVNAINYNTAALRDVVRELSETRHQIERVRDKMT